MACSVIPSTRRINSVAPRREKGHQKDTTRIAAVDRQVRQTMGQGVRLARPGPAITSDGGGSASPGTSNFTAARWLSFSLSR